MQDAVELRGHVARSLHGSADSIASEAVGVYPFAGMEKVGADHRAHLTQLAVQLIIAAVRDGTLDPKHVVVSTLLQVSSERQVGVHALFTVIYLVERAALDALALDDSFGVASEPWPALTQLVHRAAFDVCAALAEHMGSRNGDAGIADPLTTLHTRAVFLAALDKEIQRSERLGEPFAVILIDVDRLADINARYGYGAGDRVLERVGIVVRNYFRDTDWVARLAEDTFAILLPAIQGHNAERLAERMRISVQERLQIHDHRSDQQFPVTISIGVLVAEVVSRTARAEGLVAAAEEAIERAKLAGGNRVERAEPAAG